MRVFIDECITNPVNTEQCGTYYPNSNTDPDLPKLQINWDDGTPVQTILNYTNDSQIDHIYAQSGDYFVTTTYTFEDLNGDEQEIVDGDGSSELKFVVGEACTSENKSQYANIGQGQYFISCKIWINHILGTNHGSYTHFWKIKNNGSIERAYAAIYTKIDGIFRERDNCALGEQRFGSKTKGHARKAEKVKSKLFNGPKWKDGEIWSQHWYVKSGVFKEIFQ